MRVKLLSFQERTVADLRAKLHNSAMHYDQSGTQQVISLQAPTGAGKTIIMAALIESVFCGSDGYEEQPDAIFVWLSDSPSLNAQSRDKIEHNADCLDYGRCRIIEDVSFDREVLEDGVIYFLNTQKLSKTSNLAKHSDSRQYTIWETLSNTVKEKGNRLYFIIDEAHRGAQGGDVQRARTIMQKCIKGDSELGVPAMPLVVGVSATAERFDNLVSFQTSAAFYKSIVHADEVRASGLLKDRIVIVYPKDDKTADKWAILQAAADEWKDKCEHWRNYSREQHCAQVNPILLIQVVAGSADSVSETDLAELVDVIEKRLDITFKEYEVVHTFGSVETLMLGTLPVHHVSPEYISVNQRIRVVLFKENLTTGWDCPRAEAMMSFRRAKDTTYIAQLLGRMIRTPFHRRVAVDDSLNEVKLFLPYFNRETVRQIIDELQHSETGELPTDVAGEYAEDVGRSHWTVDVKPKKCSPIAAHPPHVVEKSSTNEKDKNGAAAVGSGTSPIPNGNGYPQLDTDIVYPSGSEQGEPFHLESGPDVGNSIESQALGESDTTAAAEPKINRPEIINYINRIGLLQYKVSLVSICNNYIKSLSALATLLTLTGICPDARDRVLDDVAEMIHRYNMQLHADGIYAKLAQDVCSMALNADVYETFGGTVEEADYLLFSEDNLDRLLRGANIKLQDAGFTNRYFQKYADLEDLSAYKTDCILFARNDDCMDQLGKYAKETFHHLNDTWRMSTAELPDAKRNEYRAIVGDSDKISKHNFILPTTILGKDDADGEVYDNHLFANEETGIVRIQLNNWERAIIEEEAKREDFVCWLRNVPNKPWALCIPYSMNGENHKAFPDFIVIRKGTGQKQKYILDILEPHRGDLADNLPKVKAFAEYAASEAHALHIGRFEVIRQGKDAAGNVRFKRLNLTGGKVVEEVRKAQTAGDLDYIFHKESFSSPSLG